MTTNEEKFQKEITYLIEDYKQGKIKRIDYEDKVYELMNKYNYKHKFLKPRNPVDYTKVNFPEETKQSMHNLINITRNNNREFGGSLCVDDKNNVHLDSVHRGHKLHAVKTSIKCSKDKKMIGDFHTHPETPNGEGRDNTPSTQDLSISYRYGGLDCIGFARNDKIKCKVRKDQYDPNIYRNLLYEEKMLQTPPNRLIKDKDKYYQQKEEERKKRKKITENELFNNFFI